MAKLSDKGLRQMQENAKNYSERLSSLRADMEERGLDRYYLPKGFDLSDYVCSKDVFKTGAACPQKTPMPFSDRIFSKFMWLPKESVGSPVLINNKGKVVHGTYLIAKEDRKPILFAFSIVRNADDKFAYKDFSIKLDMLVAGKEWLTLFRFDGLDNPHPNYIVNNKVVKDKDHIQYVGPSHIHINNQNTQVLTSDLSYTCAMEAPKKITKFIESNDQEYFKRALDYALEMCGMTKVKLDEKNKDRLFDYVNTIFTY